MEATKRLAKKLRDISFIDRLRARISNCPAIFAEHSDDFDNWMKAFLDKGVEIQEVDAHEMVLKNSAGASIKLWVGSYPYSYGNRVDIGCAHPHNNLYPGWDVVFMIRELQLSKRDQVIDDLRAKITEAA